MRVAKLLAKGRNRARLFRHRLLDTLLTRAHPATPAVMYTPLAGLLAWQAHDAGVASEPLVGWFAAGLAVWTLFEYLLHRFFLHLPELGERTRLVGFLVHGHHHAFPDDPMRLVAPPLQSLLAAVLLGGLFHTTLGEGRWAAALAGALVGYVAYEGVHYAIHHTRWGGPIGWLRRHHLAHHADPGARFGISSPLWDWLLRTR